MSSQLPNLFDNCYFYSFRSHWPMLLLFELLELNKRCYDMHKSINLLARQRMYTSKIFSAIIMKNIRIFWNPLRFGVPWNKSPPTWWSSTKKVAWLRNSYGILKPFYLRNWQSFLSCGTLIKNFNRKFWKHAQIWLTQHHLRNKWFIQWKAFVCAEVFSRIRFSPFSSSFEQAKAWL